MILPLFPLPTLLRRAPPWIAQTTLSFSSMSFRMTFGYNQDRLLGQEAESEKTFPGTAMTKWA
eukprot:6781394-Pyramimonas_sp.AAC.1